MVNNIKKLLLVIIFFLVTPILVWVVFANTNNTSLNSIPQTISSTLQIPTSTPTTSTSTTTLSTVSPQPIENKKPTTTPYPIEVSSTEKTVRLPVPFYWEIPDGVWVPPWSGACEEASVVAVEGYYLNKPHIIVEKEESKAIMFPLFGIENKLFGYNIDTNATETAKLINEYTSFEAKVKTNPSLEDLISEIDAGRPVITMHYGYGLQNPRHRFRHGGSSYHLMVLTGYDEKNNEFFVNDSELKDGIDLRYKYDIILSTLHDFDHKTKKANGVPTVLFTKEKQIVRSSDSKLFLIRENKKYEIANEEVMQNHRWDLKLIKTISDDELAKFEAGEEPIIE